MKQPRWMRATWHVVDREGWFVSAEKLLEGEKPLRSDLTKREAKNCAARANAERTAIREAKKRLENGA